MHANVCGFYFLFFEFSSLLLFICICKWKISSRGMHVYVFMRAI